MDAADAVKIIERFEQADPCPPCHAAATDDGSMLGFEWAFPDGALWIDLYSNGDIKATWHDKK